MTSYLRSSLTRTLAIAAAVGVAIISLLALGGGKDTLLQTLGVQSAKGSSLANNTCVVPSEQDEVYFVSCAGFF